jgi:hypothetical protein
MPDPNNRPEENPVEGSRKVIDHELQRQDDKGDSKVKDDRKDQERWDKDQRRK